MKFDPGYYKIKRKGRSFVERVETMRITLGKEHGRTVKYIQFSNGKPEILHEEDEKYHVSEIQILKKFSRSSPLHYNKMNIQITFQDQDGDTFEMNVKTLLAFMDTMQQFPRLFKSLRGEKIQLRNLEKLIGTIK